jgi:hypothetical protein
MKLIIHLSLVPRTGIRWTLPPRILYVFIAWCLSTRSAVPLFTLKVIRSRVSWISGGVLLSGLHRVQSGFGAYPVSCLMGTGAPSPRVKRPGREADHSPPSSAEVKNAWSYTSIPPVFMAWYLVKTRANFLPVMWLYNFVRRHLRRTAIINFRTHTLVITFFPTKYISCRFPCAVFTRPRSSKRL